MKKSKPKKAKSSRPKGKKKIVKKAKRVATVKKIAPVSENSGGPTKQKGSGLLKIKSIYPEYIPLRRPATGENWRLIFVAVSGTALMMGILFFSFNYFLIPSLTSDYNFSSTNNQPQVRGESEAVPASYQIPLNIKLDQPLNNNQESSPTDWQVYQNQTAGYVFKYPQNWQLTKKGETVILTNDLAKVAIQIKTENNDLLLLDYLVKIDKVNLAGSNPDQLLNQEMPGPERVKRVFKTATGEEIRGYYQLTNQRLLLVSLSAETMDSDLIDFFDQIFATFSLIN